MRCSLPRRGGLLAAVVVSLLAAPAAAMTQHETELYEKARSEGPLTWYVAQYSAESAEKIGLAFSEAYPGLQVNVVRTTGQVAFTRLNQDIRAGVANCDVFSGTDLGHHEWLKENGLIAGYVPENASKVFEAFRDIDPDGMYHATNANLVVLVHNTNLVADADAPQNWTDLVDPKWKDQAALGHPGFSGTMGAWAVLMRRLYGWEYFERMAANNPQIGRSLNDPITTLNGGERQVGIAALSTAIRSRSRGNPIGVVYPADGAMVQINASSILENAPNPASARLFVEFLLSVRNSEVIVGDSYEPLRPEVDPPTGSRRIADVKVLRVDLAELIDGVPEIKEKWRDTFGN